MLTPDPGQQDVKNYTSQDTELLPSFNLSLSNILHFHHSYRSLHSRKLLNVSPVDSHPVLRKNAGLRHRPLSLRRHAPGCPISPGRRRPRLPGSPHRDYEEGMSRSSSLAISAMPPSLSPIPSINFPPHNVVNGQLELTCPGSLERLRKYTDRQSLKTAHPDNASSKNATRTALVPLPAVVVDAGLPAISPARTPLRLLEVVSTACPFTMERFDTIEKFGRSWYGLGIS